MNMVHSIGKCALALALVFTVSCGKKKTASPSAAPAPAPAPAEAISESELALIIKMADSWGKLQTAYAMETGKFGDCSQIGLQDNDDIKSFARGCGSFPSGGAYWEAKNINSIGECKAGSKWVVYMNSKDSEVAIELPGGPCQDIMQGFGKPPEAPSKPEASASEAKCGTHSSYNYKTHFCYETSTADKSYLRYSVHELCDGKEYNFITQYCEGNKVLERNADEAAARMAAETEMAEAEKAAAMVAERIRAEMEEAARKEMERVEAEIKEAERKAAEDAKKGR